MSLKPLKIILLLILIGSLISPVIFIGLATDRHALVSFQDRLSYDDLKRAQQIIKTNKPRRIYLKRTKSLLLSEKDLDLVMAYGLDHGLDIHWLSAASEIRDGHLRLIFSAPLPGPLSSRVLNLSLTFQSTESLVALTGIRAGKIRLPEIIVRPAAAYIHERLLKTDAYQRVWQHTDLVKQVRLENSRVRVFYNLDRKKLEEIKETGRSFFLAEAQQLALIDYHNHLAELIQQVRREKDPLIRIVREMFGYAGERTARSGHPDIENATAIKVLSLYLGHKRLEKVVSPELKRKIKPAQRLRMTFYNRADLPKHFFISAALAVSTGSRFAGLVGLGKEIGDSDGGSGFSFADIAADKAGVKFGKAATDSPELALQFQSDVSRIADVSDLMPSIENLPEGIMELEFKTQYSDLDSETYQMINREIDHRISACTIYRSISGNTP